MSKHCLACGAQIEYEPGVGWVDVNSGDNGGTYDICPANNGNTHDPKGTS